MAEQFEVTQATDDGTGSTTGTLSWAINQANADPGVETIILSTNVRLNGVSTKMLNAPINSDIIIDGGASTKYTISGDNNNNGVVDEQDKAIFFILSGNVTLKNLTITGGVAKGDDTNRGGGGGTGMGGALFIYEGNVTVENVTFNNNQALGGNAGVTTASNFGGGSNFSQFLGGPQPIDGSNGLPGFTGGDGGDGGNGGFGVGGGNGGYGGAGTGIRDTRTTGGDGGDGGFGGFGAGGGHGGNGGYGGYGDGGFGGYGGDGGYGGGGGGGGGRGGGYGGGGSGFNGFGGSGGGNGNSTSTPRTLGFGGGGAGMGGAIFIRSGELNLVNSVFQNNSATGGISVNAGSGLGGAIFAMKSLTNSNGNNQGMPTTLPTVRAFNVSFNNNTANSAGTGNTGTDGVGINQDNQDVWGNISALPTIAINDVTVTEGTGGNTQATVTVNLNAASSFTVGVNYATANNSATTPADYTSTTGNLTFNAGVISQTITIPIVTDNLDENNETFLVNLTNPSNATIADNQATVTITDDDNSPSLSIADATVTEGTGGNNQATVTVNLSAASSLPIGVNFATANNSATTPADYTATTGNLTFNPGVTSQTITIPIVTDSLDENNETFLVNLTNPSNATIADNQATVTITDDDNSPSLSIADATVTEGTGGNNQATVTVNLSAASSLPIGVNFATANNSATTPADYTATTGNLTFNAGVTSQTITIPIVTDNLDENNETFLVNLTNPSNATIADNQATVTITDDDNSPSLSIADATVTEGTGGVTQATVTVNLSAASSLPIGVNFATANNSATTPADYTATTGNLTFNPGVTSQTITIPIVTDSLDENNETFLVNLTNPSNATIADNQATVTITDDDNPPSLSIADATVTEGTGGVTQATVAVNLSAASSLPVTVNFATANNSATTPADYTATTGNLTFNAGVTSQTITIPIVTDNLDENNETFLVNLTNPSNATIADNQATVTITDDDNSPSLSIADATVTEGTGGVTQATVAVNLSAASSLPVTVNFATANNSATTPADYTATTGNLTFNAGVTSQTITIPIVTDNLDENNETFLVNLTNPSNATIADNQATVTITDDDNPPSLSIADATVTEGTGGVTQATVAVNLSAASSLPVTVNFATANNSATTPADYTATTGNLTFNAGVTSQTITIPIVTDNLDENNETFLVNLTNPSNATIADNQATVTITDDDNSPSLSIADATVTEGTGGVTQATVAVNLSAASSLPVTVNFATANNSATTPADYTATTGNLTFNAGVTSQTITIPIVTDNLDENNETFLVNLTNPSNATIADNQATVTITDDDNSPSLSIADATVTEGTGGVTQATVTVNLSAASSLPIGVNFATANNSATTPADYTATTGNLTFNPGVTSQTITIPIVTDSLDENNETFLVNLTNPSNATIADNQATVTITDDDNSPSLSIADATVTEGTGGVTQATVAVNLSAASSLPVTVNFATANNSATTPADYTATTGNLTFNAGVTSQTITIPIVTDNLDENNETFLVNLTNPSNATIADNQATVTITDDDNSPSLSIADATVTEGTGGNNQATVTVNLSAASSLPIGVNFATANNSATTPADYTSTTGNLTFNAGETSKTITIPIVTDNLDENNETFLVNLTNPSNATIANNQATVTITDDDNSPSLSIADATVTEGTGGVTQATVTVNLSAASSLPVTVNFATANNSATTPADYTATTGNLTFNAGVTSQTITIPIVTDSLDENNETFLVNLTNPSNATIVDNQATVTITDDDNSPSLSIADATVTEGTGGVTQATVTVNLSAASSLPVGVSFATANNSATTPADYTATTGNLTFNPGVTSQTITIPIVTDNLDENNETFLVNLTNPSNATIADNQATVTITDDDNSPSLSIADATVTEGTGGVTQATVTVNLSAARSLPVGVSFATANNSATTPADYTSTTGNLTFNAGETSKTITIPIVTDNLDENNETFLVNLTNPSNATIADNQATVTITDDDNSPSLSIADATVTEGTGGVNSATVTVNLSAASSLPIGVNFATANNSATTPADYTATSGNLTFNAGVTSQTITIPIVTDNLDENNETFLVNLTNPSNATIADNQATVTITDDDNPPVISLSDRITVEGNVGERQSIFTLTLSNPSSKNITVNYATEDNTATAGSDYTSTTGVVNFAPRETSKTISVAILSDTIFEPDESFIVNLTNPTNSTIDNTANSVVGAIINDDLPSLSISDTRVTERNSGSLTANVTVSLNGAFNQPVTVAYTTADNTATAPSDYTANSGILTFAPFETSKTISVAIAPDRIEEVNETFFVNLSNPTRAIIADNQGIVTILDNDSIPTISINNVSQLEGNSDSEAATLTVSLSNPSSQTITVDYNTTPDTATAHVDYTNTTGRLTFSPGETSKTIEVDILGDTIFEPTERLFVDLANAVNAQILDAQAVITITNDDQNFSPLISINDVNLVEGNTDSTSAAFVVTLGSSSNLPITVSYTTIARTALPNTDYTTTTGTITFNPGETQKEINVPIVNNNLNEPDESFELVLSNPQNGTILDGTGTALISDTLVSSVTPILPPLVENLTLGGTGNINGTGNTGNNIITGNRGNNNLNGDSGNDSLIGDLGNDTLDGSTGNDTLTGDAGSDTYVVNAIGDVVNETVTGSSPDTVQSTISYTLGNNLENLVLLGTTAINGSGNAANNLISGNNSRNILTGDAGNDTLSGNAGNDTLTGGVGSDRLNFNTDNAFATTDLGIDTITDFIRAQDKLVLDKTTFTAITSTDGNGFSNTSEFASVTTDAAAAISTAVIVYNSANGKLFYNQNGNATGLGTGGQFANLTGNPLLTATDIVITL